MFDFDLPADLSWRVARIPKEDKPGEFRKLTIPNDDLMLVQNDILQYLYTVKELWPTIFAHGFVPCRNTSTGVARHDRLADVFVCEDVKDFFDNFPIKRTEEKMLDVLPCKLVEKMLAACTYKGHLPQGGPCSPWLTNIGMIDADKMISAFAKKHGFTYTRYADDMTFSQRFDVTGNKPSKSYRFLTEGVDKIMREYMQLRLNRKKSHVIRLSGSDARQVTGVVIRKDGMGYNAPSKMRRMVRAMLCNLANKVYRQHGRYDNDDLYEWHKIIGYVRYFDNLRSYGEGDAAYADPVIQPKFWNYLMEVMPVCQLTKSA